MTELLPTPVKNRSDAPAPGDTPLLLVEDLVVEFVTERGVVRAVDGVTYHVDAGEVLGIVGGSGSGKTISIQAILGLLADPRARIVRGRAAFQGKDLFAMKPRAVRSLLGREIGMVFQEPVASLNPVFKIGRLLAEAIGVDRRATASRRTVREQAVDLLKE